MLTKIRILLGQCQVKFNTFTNRGFWELPIINLYHMKKVLMVCLGNICRSPMAEGVFRQLAAVAHLDVFVDSAGTSNYHNGEHPDKRAIACLKQKGIDIENLNSRQFIIEDFDNFDLIYAMDRLNYRYVTDMAKNEDQSQKVKVLVEEFPHGNYEEVPDPYFKGAQEFEEVYDLLHSTCQMLVTKLKSEFRLLN